MKEYGGLGAFSSPAISRRFGTWNKKDKRRYYHFVRRKMNMKIGCGTVLFREYDLERSLDAIRKIGFEYFETQAVGPWCGHVNIETDDPEKLVRLKNKY